MSILSFFGIIILFMHAITYYNIVQLQKQNKNSNIFILLYNIGIMIVIIAEIILAWKIGPGLYDAKFWN